MVELFANSDQTPRSVVSDLGRLCLLVTRLAVSSQWIRIHVKIHVFHVKANTRNWSGTA